MDGAKNAINEYNKVHGTNYKHSQIHILEANVIAGWTNLYLDAVTFVQGANGINRPMGLKTIAELGDYPIYQEIKFHTNPKLDMHIQQIQQTIAQERSSLRIIGHSGLGKTRLVYEALNASSAIQKAVYFDVVKDADGIIQFVRTFGKRLSGILVVDNCDYYTHKLLKDEITRTGSSLKLITIDYNVAEEVDKSKTTQENYIFLSNKDYLEVVKNILNDQFEGRLDRTHIDQIADYSEGYPGMAVLFAQARIDGNDDLSELLGDDVIQRLAFGRDWENNDADKFEILKSCSIFSSFGRPSRDTVSLLTPEEKVLFSEQMNFIISSICDPSKSRKNFLEGTDYFEDRRVMERRGYYLSVKPTPLAIKLAMNWWKYFDHTELVTLFPELERLQLAVPLVNRLSELDQLREAKEIVNDLWGEKSPFGSAEVLNTPLGSRLFRSVAQVNPEAAMSALEASFAKMDLNTLKSDYGPGRRYIIWTLEILAFRKNFFERAVNLMFRFAAAENENITNNASGQLLQLFQIILPGTEADLEQRLSAIRVQLKSTEPEVRHLAVLALLRGLKGESFRRDIGAEQQGSSAPLIDFRPTWPQSAAYWDAIIDELLVIAKESPAERGLIKEALPRSFRNLFYNNLSHLVEKIISEFQSIDNSFWEDAINQLKTAMEYEVVNDDERNLVNKLLAVLQPQTLEDQVKFYVSFPAWDYEHKSADTYVDYGAINAEKFAEKLVSEKIDVKQILPVLLTGEQRKGYSFGKKLGELMQNPQLADDMLAALKAIDRSKQNPEVAGAYIATLQIDERNKLLHTVLSDNVLSPMAIYFIRIQDPDYEQLNSLFSLLDNGTIEPIEFYQFTYGRGLDHLSIQEVFNFFSKLSTYNNAALIALELANQYIGKSDEKWQLFKPFMRSLIIDQNLLMLRTRSQSQYALFDIVERLLKSGEDLALMKVLTLQLLETAKDDRISSIDSYLKRTVQRIMQTDFNMFWEIIGPAILDNATYMSFKFFLGPNNGERAHPGLMALADEQILVDWCKANSPVGPKRIAYMMPLTVLGDSKTWHPLAIRMINEFGDIPGLMNEVGANLHSFGSVGSQVPYLEDQLSLVSKMLNHPLNKVREWAGIEMKGLKKRIERTKLDDQSDYLNY